MELKRGHWLLLALPVVAIGLWCALRWGAVDPGPDPKSEAASEPSVAVDPEPPAAPQTSLPPVAETARPDAAATPTPAPAVPAAAPQAQSPQRSGPVEELARRFQREPRASAAGALETKIQKQFQQQPGSAGLLTSVLCRTTVCRVETRWSPERAQGFLAALMSLVAQPNGQPAELDPELAIDPAEAADSDASRAITVYLQPGHR